MLTTQTFNPVLKERYKNPVISQMLGKLRRNNRPRKQKIESKMKSPHQRRAPKEF